MDASSILKLLFKAILLVSGIAFVVRLIQAKMSFKDHSDELDFDERISLMKKRIGGAYNLDSQPQEKPKKNIKEYYEQRTTGEEQRKILELVDAIQWGHAKQSLKAEQNLKKVLGKSSGYTIGFFSALKQVLEESVLHDVVYSFSEIEEKTAQLALNKLFTGAQLDPFLALLWAAHQKKLSQRKIFSLVILDKKPREVFAIEEIREIRCTELEAMAKKINKFLLESQKIKKDFFQVNEKIRKAYKVLDVSLDFSDEEIKKAFNKLALSLHPDKNPGQDTLAKYQEVQSAMELIKEHRKSFHELSKVLLS